MNFTVAIVIDLGGKLSPDVDESRAWRFNGEPFGGFRHSRSKFAVFEQEARIG